MHNKSYNNLSLMGWSEIDIVPIALNYVKRFLKYVVHLVLLVQ